MGESQPTVFQPDFNHSINVEGSSDRLTSNGGALLLREADHRLGLMESLGEVLQDPRDQKRIRYTMVELMRERVYALALGHSVQDDVDRLAHDPAMKIAVWNRSGDRVIDERLASQPTQSRLVENLADSRNRNAMREALADWTHRHLRSTDADRRVRHAVIDIDSFPITVYGSQDGASYNGYYKDTVYHPLIASFSVGGDYDSTRIGKRLGNGFIHATLRQGQVHTAHGVKRFVENTVRKARQMAYQFELRLDAGYTAGHVMDYLTDEKVRFYGRLKTNAVIQRLAAPHLKRPPGRPPAEGYEKVIELGQYSAQGWSHSQRLILVVVDQPDPKSGQLNLIPNYFFLVTNLSEDKSDRWQVLEDYRQRGTFEDRLGEFKQTISPHLSSQSFVSNEATMLLGLLAYNLTSMLRIELEDDLGGCWDLGRFQATVLRAGGRVVKGSRYLRVDITQCVVDFWQRLVQRIRQLRLPIIWPQPKGARRRPWVAPPRHAHLSEVLRE
jgi:hypothetical protein